jgi:hypothetical protein
VSRQKYQKWALGAVVRIPLDDTWHCYGQLLRDVDVAVFDTLTTGEWRPRRSYGARCSSASRCKRRRGTAPNGIGQAYCALRLMCFFSGLTRTGQ